jgi:DNA-binding MarR family transcriptional regulator
MHTLKDENLKSIFQLRSNLENVFFRHFENQVDFPKKLNHTHFKTMIILSFEGELPMSEVSHKLSLEKGSFTPVANTLIKLGFIIKRQSPDDRRIYTISLTPEGLKFAEKYKSDHMHFIRDRLKRLSDAEREAYLSSVRTLNALMDKIK